jgi:cyclopropane-fatty-acyl-phospholipid synthase
MDIESKGTCLSLPRKSAISKSRQIIVRLFGDFNYPLGVEFGGETVTFGSRNPPCTLVFKHVKPLRDLILFHNPLLLADAHFRGLVDIDGDIYTALHLREYLPALRIPPGERIALWLKSLAIDTGPATTLAEKVRACRKSMAQHTRNMNREAISFHYDVSNDFYRLWLDNEMVYSCAYFKSADNTLNDAQKNKLDLICRKLQLKPGEKFLDIGCGWGALAIWATQHYGVKAHGITLSRNQHDYAYARIRELNLEDRVTIELMDYRDLEGIGVYDKISSVGMFEHVGLKNLPVYFNVAHRLLKDGGLFLNHGITQDEEGGKPTLGFRFITRYVFPDGQLDWVSHIAVAMERAGFEIHDVESLRRHYEMTLRQWVSRLETKHEAALKIVPEGVHRIWRMYMAGCALQFENGELGVYQLLAIKRNRHPAALPLTRGT